MSKIVPLAACPFCGGTKLVPFCLAQNIRHIICLKCNARGPSEWRYIEGDAVAAWNRRAEVKPDD